MVKLFHSAFVEIKKNGVRKKFGRLARSTKRLAVMQMLRSTDSYTVSDISRKSKTRNKVTGRPRLLELKITLSQVGKLMQNVSLNVDNSNN